ncbi:MAG: sulfotransferase [Geminicoccaceae bacterium]
MIRLFLVGSPRSGTTLLQTILATQLQLYTLKETHFFRNLHRWRPVRLLDRLRLDPTRVEAAFGFITGNNRLEGNYDISKVATLAQACSLFDTLLSTEATLRGQSGWLEKTPEHMFFMDEIRAHVPGARFVHILRDGPDVVASLYDAFSKYPDHWGWLGDIDRMVSLYNRYARVTAANRSRDDTFVVRYDDLVTGRAATLDRLAVFVGLEPGSLTLDQVSSWRGDIVRPDEAWKVRSENKVVDTRGTKFKSLFDDSVRARILTRLTDTADIPSG